MIEQVATAHAGVQPALWTVHQVCHYLNVGRTTVYELVKRGDLRAKKIGNATRFDPAEVMAYVGSL